MMKLKCEDAELLMQEYLDGYLLAGQREALEGHLEECGSCPALLRDIRRLDSLMESFPQVEPPEGFARQIEESLPPVRYSREWRRKSVSFLGALAASLVLFTSGIFFSTGDGKDDGLSFREVEFSFVSPSAASVAIVGDFNDWDASRHQLQKVGDDGTWKVRVRLAAGSYQYGFFIDGRRWAPDPHAERFLADGFGGENSIILVES